MDLEKSFRLAGGTLLTFSGVSLLSSAGAMLMFPVNIIIDEIGLAEFSNGFELIKFQLGATTAALLSGGTGIGCLAIERALADDEAINREDCSFN